MKDDYNISQKTTSVVKSCPRSMFDVLITYGQKKCFYANMVQVGTSDKKNMYNVFFFVTGTFNGQNMKTIGLLHFFQFSKEFLLITHNFLLFKIFRCFFLRPL